MTELSLLQTPPTREELGYADAVIVDELGDTSVVIFRIDGSESRIATIVIRSSTDSYMDDIERAIDDGVNTFKGITKVSLIYTCIVMQLLWRYRISSISWLQWKMVKCLKKILYCVQDCCYMCDHIFINFKLLHHTECSSWYIKGTSGSFELNTGLFIHTASFYFDSNIFIMNRYRLGLMFTLSWWPFTHTDTSHKKKSLKFFLELNKMQFET